MGFIYSKFRKKKKSIIDPIESLQSIESGFQILADSSKKMDRTYKRYLRGIFVLLVIITVTLVCTLSTPFTPLYIIILICLCAGLYRCLSWKHAKDKSYILKQELLLKNEKQRLLDEQYAIYNNVKGVFEKYDSSYLNSDRKPDSLRIPIEEILQ